MTLLVVIATLYAEKPSDESLSVLRATSAKPGASRSSTRERRKKCPGESRLEVTRMCSSPTLETHFISRTNIKETITANV